MRTKADHFLRVLTVILVICNLAVSAIDGYSVEQFWSSGRALITSLLISSLAIVLIVRYIREPSSNSVRPSAESCLLVAWIAWAVLGFVIHGNSGLSIFALGFPILAAAAHRVVLDDSSFGVARILAIAVFVHILGAAIVTGLTSAEAFDGQRLDLLSLEPNELARVAGFGILGGLWLLRSGKRSNVLIGVCSVGFSSTALLLTVSRTSILGVFVAAAVIVAYSAHKRLAALALGAGLLFFVVPLSLRTEPTQLGPATAVAVRSSQGVMNFGGRSILWPLVLDKARESPIYGLGIGNDQAAMNTLRVEWDPQHAHNMALHLYLTTGVFGTVLLLSALAMALVRASVHGRGLALSLGVFVLINGVSEPVIRMPSIGWFALASTVFLAAQSYDSAKVKTNYVA